MLLDLFSFVRGIRVDGVSFKAVESILSMYARQELVYIDAKFECILTLPRLLLLVNPITIFLPNIYTEVFLFHMPSILFAISLSLFLYLSFSYSGACHQLQGHCHHQHHHVPGLGEAV